MTTLSEAVSRLHKEAIALQALASSAAHWVASDVLRELQSEAVQRRLNRA